MWRSTCFSSLMALIVVCLPSTAAAARKPTPTERSALTQAAYDALVRDAAPNVMKGTVKLSFRVSTRAPKFPKGTRFYYSSFATVDVYNPQVGGAVMLFGYYVSGLPAWR